MIQITPPGVWHGGGMQQSQGQSSKHGRMNPSLKSEGYGDKVIQQLNNLRSRNELCDFKVSAGEKSFQVVS